MVRHCPQSTFMSILYFGTLFVRRNVKRKTFLTTVGSKVDDCLFHRLLSSSPVGFSFELSLTMVLPRGHYGLIVLDCTSRILRDVGDEEPHGTVGVPAIQEVTLVGPLFTEWDRHRRLGPNWSNCLLPKSLWRADVAYADSLIHNSARAEMVRMSEGKFQVLDNFVCDRLFVESVGEAKDVTNLEVLLIQRFGTVGDMTKKIFEVYADRAVDYNLPPPPLRKCEKQQLVQHAMESIMLTVVR